jgi:hypothetical protein
MQTRLLLTGATWEVRETAHAITRFHLYTRAALRLTPATQKRSSGKTTRADGVNGPVGRIAPADPGSLKSATFEFDFWNADDVLFAPG